MLVVLGVLTVIGVALIFVRPEIAERIGLGNISFAKDRSNSATQVPQGKVYAILSASQGTLVPDTTATDPNAVKSVDISELTEAQNTGFPPRNIPYLAVINTAKKEVRYWKLSKIVRKVAVRSNPTFGYEIKQPGNSPGAPYQIEIWVPREGDLNLEFDIGPPSAGSGSA
jgi:hypothetical protein